RAEDDERTGAPAADDRDVAPVVARNLLLLVRRVVLLVDDDEADALERRKDGRARADDDVDVAAADALPLIVALAVAEAAVLNGDAVAERRAEERGRRRRERDLRDQHQDAASGIADGSRETNVDLGLAAAGDAVQQRDAELAGLGQLAKPIERRLLLAGEGSEW